MEVVTAQYNIGGGRICAPGEDPTEPASYSVDGMNDILAVLSDAKPDIITLQEAHASHHYSQVQAIANSLGFSFFHFDSIGASHIDPDMSMGQAIISRFPVMSHVSLPLPNPDLRKITDNGTEIHTHDSTVTKSRIHLPKGKVLDVLTMHLTPFEFFDEAIASNRARTYYAAVQKQVGVLTIPTVVQGDFNINSRTIMSTWPELGTIGLSGIPNPNPTTPKGKILDHVLFSGVHLKSQRVETNVATDHYPVFTEFTV